MTDRSQELLAALAYQANCGVQWASEALEEIERLEQVIAGGYVQHLPKCDLFYPGLHTVNLPDRPKACTCGLSAILQRSPQETKEP